MSDFAMKPEGFRPKAHEACICGEWTEIESYNDDEAYNAMLNRFYEQHPKCRSWHIYFDYDEEENTIDDSGLA